MSKATDIALSFFRVGILGYGGGPSSIPLVYKEVVEKYEWMDADEFADVLALANALPGPILTKLAGYIGYRVAGSLGLVFALLSSVMPTVLLVIILFLALQTFQQQQFIAGMTKAISPVIAVMIGTLAWQFAKRGAKGLGHLINTIALALSAIAILLFHLHPAILILLCLILALLPRKERSRNEASS
ncbi:chromate transporter [Aureibacillus halotolerans]|uniref:Chromate transporter n=1 Tax=Aureibacillus halotolerans TaxID=1508390 RepID=A0A4R6U8L0_9BACI|nr:chromate transporter [Aureibacillus halotolerans]TDQ42731.1 chromate transporter [Aureibacillus halotolerans]